METIFVLHGGKEIAVGVIERLEKKWLARPYAYDTEDFHSTLECPYVTKKSAKDFVKRVWWQLKNEAVLLARRKQIERQKILNTPAKMVNVPIFYDFLHEAIKELTEVHAVKIQFSISEIQDVLEILIWHKEVGHYRFELYDTNTQLKEVLECIHKQLPVLIEKESPRYYQIGEYTKPVTPHPIFTSQKLVRPMMPSPAAVLPPQANPPTSPVMDDLPF